MKGGERENDVTINGSLCQWPWRIKACVKEFLRVISFCWSRHKQREGLNNKGRYMIAVAKTKEKS